MSNEGPIIIRKKRSDDEEEHHGGVWKLAFADFMTAMMAFFLVMWLINSTSKETKAVIVQYFNPIKLGDAPSARKGLSDPTDRVKEKAKEKHASDENAAGSASNDADALFSDPMQTLGEIAARELVSAQTLRDPFDRPTKNPPTIETKPVSKRELDISEDAMRPPSAFSASALSSQIQSQIDKITSKETHAPKIDVKKTEEGLLVSLTDDANFSMFDIGSVRPKPQLVRILADIGKVLASKSGDIEIRGYTDARAYNAKNYDNWRLSSDRATAVNYMLLRGGMPANRVAKISGFADRQLKDPKAPLSPANRRIEILLRGAS